MTTLPKLTESDQTTLSDLGTKSAKIRFLASKNWSRGQIALKLEIRYQHVRNVLITPVKNPRT